MIWLVIIGLLGYSIYEFVGAVALLWSIIPFVAVLPLVAYYDLKKWWVNRHRRKRSATRYKAWRADLEARVRRYHEMFPEGDDRDENGIRYDFGVGPSSDDRPAVRPPRPRFLR